MPDSSPPGTSRSLPQVRTVFEAGREAGLHLGLQLWVAHQGEVLVDAAFGERSPGEPLSADDWLPWLSAGKPATAVLILQAQERGLLSIDDRVSDWIDGFAVQGKQALTVRHLLTHTAGLRLVEPGWPECDWDETIARIAAAPLDADAIPGETAGYHVSSTWFLLGEILRRVYGLSLEQVMESFLFQPCGMTETRLSLSPDEFAAYSSQLAPLWERTKEGLRLSDWHQAAQATHPSPGSSLRGPIRDLGAFYETLRRILAGESLPVLSPAGLREMITRQRIGQFDLTLRHRVDFGLGVIINSSRYGVDTVPYGYGRFAGAETFGHGGSQCSQGYCDPTHELVVAYVFNGRPGEPQHQRRCRQLNEAIYTDLGLTGG